MESEWTHCTVGDALTLQRGFDITKNQQSVGFVPVVSSGGIKSFHSEAIVKAPGVVLGRKGTLGTVFFLEQDFWPHDTTLWIKDFKGNHAKFLYYFFRNISKALQSLDVGTSNPALNRNHVHPIEMQLPPLAEQRAIAHILGSLDDKIELNRRMNETLEGMAQALFKSWFMDFDPVIDNALVAGNPIPEELADRAEVRRAALANGTANREAAKPFPAAFQHTEELGWIPAGWEVGIVSDLFELHRGFDLPATERQDGEVPVYSAGGIHGFHNEYRLESPGIITGRSGVIGNVYLSLTSYWPLNTTLYVRNFRIAGPYYALHLLRNTDLNVYNSGSAVPSLNRNHVHATLTLIPHSQPLDTYESIARELFRKIKSNVTESISLTKLRDTLLPKLISGELRIPDAEKLAEAALA